MQEHGYKRRRRPLLRTQVNKARRGLTCGRGVGRQHSSRPSPQGWSVHKETWAGCIVSLTTPARSLLRASRSVSSLTEPVVAGARPRDGERHAHRRRPQSRPPRLAELLSKEEAVEERDHRRAATHDEGCYGGAGERESPELNQERGRHAQQADQQEQRQVALSRPHPLEEVSPA